MVGSEQQVEQVHFSRLEGQSKLIFSAGVAILRR
jgi:hypothetical protein